MVKRDRCGLEWTITWPECAQVRSSRLEGHDESTELRDSTREWEFHLLARSICGHRARHGLPRRPFLPLLLLPMTMLLAPRSWLLAHRPVDTRTITVDRLCGWRWRWAGPALFCPPAFGSPNGRSSAHRRLRLKRSRGERMGVGARARARAGMPRHAIESSTRVNSVPTPTPRT